MTPQTLLTESMLWEALKEVMDPEIPVVSLVDMGIVRAVETDGRNVTVTMTPTFSGCPALVVMERLIAEKMKEVGAETVEVKTVLKPAWTSDWISEEGRAKLKAFGLAPPPVHGGDVNIMLVPTVACPRCDSTNVTVKNTFGSTLCRAIYYCNDCQDAFEQFKPL
ncbi:MAG: phenylacetate-CoA oxygenase subunit PaaJ [Chloroflexi bacterium]|nr:phenylacetate-CoA oxygenase subunit PaaJ [Chloroflexota bacterium]